jgi:hypothetical protein
VALAQETQLGDQLSALSVQESRLVDAVSLITDLGGGWSDSQLHDPLDSNEAVGRAVGSANLRATQ